MTRTPALSTVTADRLKTAHGAHKEGISEPLYALVLALRLVGWPLASIATPLGVSREIVRLWQVRATEFTHLPTVTVEAPTRAVPKATIESEEVAMRRSTRERRERDTLAANLPRLLELQPLAEALRGPSKFDPTKADASAEYTRLIDTTLRGGVRGRVLADALGVQEITLHARLRRSGLRQTAPSEKVPSWAKTTEWETVVRGRVS